MARLQAEIDLRQKKLLLNLYFWFCNPQNAHLWAETVLVVYCSYLQWFLRNRVEISVFWITPTTVECVMAECASLSYVGRL